MANRTPELSEKLTTFIQAQKIFFVATATDSGRINLSPKGIDSLRIINKNRVLWLNLTGSGNETSAHVQVNPRMTLMFTAFEGKPLILRLYGTAKVIHPYDSSWDLTYKHFKALPGARQIFDLEVELVQTSCGTGTPYFEYTAEREQLNDWADKKGPQGIAAFWEKQNQTSLDGLPTHIKRDSDSV